MPSPLDIPHIKGETLEGEETEAKTSDDAPFAALAFKIATDPFVGKLCFFRVYSGTLESGSTILNSSKDKKKKELEEFFKCIQIIEKILTKFIQEILLQQ